MATGRYFIVLALLIALAWVGSDGHEPDQLSEQSQTLARKAECETIQLLSRIKEPVRIKFPLAFGLITNVKLQEEFSNSLCVQDKTFGFQKQEVFVTGGCRGLFEVCRGRQSTQELRGLYRQCILVPLLSRQQTPARTTIQSQLLVQHKLPSTYRFTLTPLYEYVSGSCESKATYGYNIEHKLISVYATDGCRAIFSACQYLESTLSPPEPVTPAIIDQSLCVQVELKSSEKEEAKKLMTHNGHLPVYIISASVVTQHSATPCVKWETYSVSGSYLSVQKGCWATFEVCYKFHGYGFY